jgi:hypothetical protein
MKPAATRDIAKGVGTRWLHQPLLDAVSGSWPASAVLGLVSKSALDRPRGFEDDPDMCNEYSNRIPPDALWAEFSHLKLNLSWAEGRPSNLEPRDSIRIRDSAPDRAPGWRPAPSWP